MAVKKLTPVMIHTELVEETDEDESMLRDKNGYMYVNFLQTILSFWMQDAPEALTQVLYYFTIVCLN